MVTLPPPSLLFFWYQQSFTRFFYTWRLKTTCLFFYRCDDWTQTNVLCNETFDDSKKRSINWGYITLKWVNLRSIAQTTFPMKCIRLALVKCTLTTLYVQVWYLLTAPRGIVCNSTLVLQLILLVGIVLSPSSPNNFTADIYQDILQPSSLYSFICTPSRIRTYDPRLSTYSGNRTHITREFLTLLPLPHWRYKCLLVTVNNSVWRALLYPTELSGQIVYCFDNEIRTHISQHVCVGEFTAYSISNAP